MSLLKNAKQIYVDLTQPYAEVELELKNSYPNVTFLSLHMFLNQRDEDCPTNWRSTLKPYPPEIPDV
ncbi:MAG: hypothetical protein SFV81_00945, partial [Pirellulaceae bacterium]|nr:hypothetical protein [Pirellulaceae bacterium]